MCGKELFTRQEKYSANLIRTKVLGQEIQAAQPAKVPARPPILCPGCPHRSVYSVLNRLKIHAAGDIGCYTLGAVAPLNVVDTTICMGASILPSWHGKSKGKRVYQKLGGSNRRFYVFTYRRQFPDEYGI